MSKHKQYVRVGGWRIDLDQVDGAIKIFQDTLENVRSFTLEARSSVTSIMPMGEDHVSTTIAKEVRERHIAGDRGSWWAFRQLQEELTKAVNTLEAAKRRYQQTENASRHSVSRT